MPFKIEDVWYPELDEKGKISFKIIPSDVCKKCVSTKNEKSKAEKS